MTKRTIKITENDIQKIVEETITDMLLCEGVLYEGKIGTALKAAALGGALMFGNPGNLNAQNTQDSVNDQIYSQSQENNINDKSTFQLKQKSEPFVFRCDDFDFDYKKLIMFKEHYVYASEEWAKTIAKHFPLDENGSIHLDYIIKCNQNFDKKAAMETTLEWLNYAFSSSKTSLQSCDYEKGVISAKGRIINIAQKNKTGLFYAKTSSIHVDVNVIIRFKDDRIKIEVFIRHYNLISADSQMNSQNTLIRINNAYPFENSENQELFTLAFINSYANAFAKIEHYLKFMNDNMKDNDGFYDDNW